MSGGELDVKGDVFLAAGAGGEADAGGGVGRAAGYPEDNAGTRGHLAHGAAVIVWNIDRGGVCGDGEHDGVALQHGGRGRAVDGVGLEP
ncbi:hypothetical protein RZS08_44910, partial [Arthrospira platensis SPKY1]|nr:hypothetical protein [Arthrospira platensis SPKY1]